jgi:DNA-binding transcriptional LysR family regulator
MNLQTIDLNLLLVFEAVLRDRSVVRAAKRLNLSQPATSHALKRLRRHLNDQLFVPTPGGMMPTPRAEQLALPVSTSGRQVPRARTTHSPVAAAERDTAWPYECA